MTDGRVITRWAPVALRTAYGLVLVVAPDRVLGLSSRTLPSWAMPIGRLLGARHVLQAVALAARPQLAGPGALVDLAHASTDVACATFRPALRVPALLDTGVAAALACSSLLTSPEESIT